MLLEKPLSKSLAPSGPAAAKPGPGNRIKKAPTERPGLALCSVLAALSGDPKLAAQRPSRDDDPPVHLKAFDACAALRRVQKAMQGIVNTVDPYRHRSGFVTTPPVRSSASRKGRREVNPPLLLSSPSTALSACHNCLLSTRTHESVGAIYIHLYYPQICGQPHWRGYFSGVYWRQ